MKIIHVSAEEHRQQASTLFREYLQWINDRFAQQLNLGFAVEEFVDDYVSRIDEFLVPGSRLLLACGGGVSEGCVGLAGNEDGTAQIHRLFVRREFRHKGVGRMLVAAILQEAREIGYSRILLETAVVMTEAVVLYESVGFRPTDPAVNSEIPPEFRIHCVTMELYL